MFETAAEVLTGQREEFVDYRERDEEARKRKTAPVQEELAETRRARAAMSMGGFWHRKTQLPVDAISVYDRNVRAFLAGAIQLHVLHHASEHEIHGAWMTTELARHGHRVSPGTLYPALHRLEAAGLLTGRDATLEGRRVRYYTITDAGQTELAANRETLQQLADEILGT